MKCITNGVPQGSILGPGIFLIYMNDIINSISLNLLPFADDTTVYQSGPRIDDLINNMNRELKQLYDRFCANKLSLNVKKIFFCIFSNVNTKSNVNSIKINNDIINQDGKNNKEESVKFLGLHLDTHLTRKQHINKISSKISRAIFAINKVKQIIPHKALKSLYYTLIHSHIMYAVQAWGNGKLATLQKRAIRIINNEGYRSHIDPIFKPQNILKIVDVYKLHVSLFMYDFHHNQLPKSFTNYIPKKNLDERSRFTRHYNLLMKERRET